MSTHDLARHVGGPSRHPVVDAIGSAGDVYLCHPFLVHAAQVNRGRLPRFIAQPPLDLVGELEIENARRGFSPVEAAVRRGLGIEEQP